MPIYFLFDFKKWRHGGHINGFFYPHDNTVLAYIANIVQDRGLVTIIHI